MAAAVTHAEITCIDCNSTDEAKSDMSATDFFALLTKAQPSANIEPVYKVKVSVHIASAMNRKVSYFGR